jgi:iron complex outermembrane receptor protein
MQKREKREESLNIEVVNDDYLRQNLGGSLMKSLERLPGVSTIDIGAGQSKPVIRGLGFNRVVVVENNIKHESQQWGADHGLEIDQFAAENIEVIKGPASLRYGSDAIGGIIHIKHNEVPQQNTIQGKVDIIGKSNNDLLGTSVFLMGRKNGCMQEFEQQL